MMMVMPVRLLQRGQILLRACEIAVLQILPDLLDSLSEWTVTLCERRGGELAVGVLSGLRIVVSQSAGKLIERLAKGLEIGNRGRVSC